MGTAQAKAINRSLHGAKRLGRKKLICMSYDSSPLSGQATLFDEYNERNGKRKKPTAIAVIVDHVKGDNHDGAVNIEDLKLSISGDQVSRIILRPDGQDAALERSSRLREATNVR